MMNTYIISLGSNQGNSLEILRQAALRLAEHPALAILQKSSIYETDPWGKVDQPVFLNAVMKISWERAPEELMQFLLEIEKTFGRTREIHWGPRTLDLDMIYGWHIESDTPLLRLPHPYFWERAFVVVPLSEICPDFLYRGETIEARLSFLGKEEVRKTKYTWGNAD